MIMIFEMIYNAIDVVCLCFVQNLLPLDGPWQVFLDVISNFLNFITTDCSIAQIKMKNLAQSRGSRYARNAHDESDRGTRGRNFKFCFDMIRLGIDKIDHIFHDR